MTYLTYGFTKALHRTTFDDAIGQVTESLAGEGFEVLSTIDVKKAIESEGGTFRRYTILGTCNAPLLKQALRADPHVGLLLPCNIVVQEAPERGVVVSIIDPWEVMALSDDPALESVATEAARRMRRVLASLV